MVVVSRGRKSRPEEPPEVGVEVEVEREAVWMCWEQAQLWSSVSWEHPQPRSPHPLLYTRPHSPILLRLHLCTHTDTDKDTGTDT